MGSRVKISHYIQPSNLSISALGFIFSWNWIWKALFFLPKLLLEINGAISFTQRGFISDCYKVNTIGQWGKILVMAMWSKQRDALVWQSIIILALLNRSIHLGTVRSDVSLLTEQLWMWFVDHLGHLSIPGGGDIVANLPWIVATDYGCMMTRSQILNSSNP